MSGPLKRGRCSKFINKEEISEDYCFVCKDGGLLLVCEYKSCIKAYHPLCVGKDDTFLESKARWICEWHSCFICHKSSVIHCFCCTNAVCKRCIKSALFVHVRRNKGFCNNCLKLALLIEENQDVDSDGGKVDFKDRDTYEFLFKDYWEIIKEKEGLTLDDVQTADKLLKKGDNYWKGSDSDKDFDADMDDNMEIQLCPLTGDLKGPRKHSRKVNYKKREFIGWGSKSLIEFLASIGKDTSKPFSQYEVHDIIKLYVYENKLTDPEKKKKIVCDAKLISVFGKKKVNRNKIYDLLELHFTENQEQSEEDEISEENEDGTPKSCKRQRIASSSIKKYEKENVPKAPKSCFASVTAKNIKLIYLRRSVVEDFLKNPETFDDKVIGTFVRFKSDPNDYFQRNPYQLSQITGTKNVSGTGNTSEELVLQVSNTIKDIHICMLSNDDFREEEIEDLHQRVKDGLLKKLTIVQVEHKARSLHEILMKHWIDRELVRLQNLIDRANEKGWRRELCEYLEKRQLLKTPSEQLRLLQELPEVIAEAIEPEISSQDLPAEGKAEKDNSASLTIPMDLTLDDLSGNGTSSNTNVRGTCAAGTGNAISTNAACEVILNLAAVDVKGDSVEELGDKIAEAKEEGNANGDAIDEKAPEKEEDADIGDAVDGEALEKKEGRDVVDEKAPEKEGHVIGDAVNEKAPNKEGGAERAALMTSEQKIIPVIELDDDDDEEDDKIWYYVDPAGERQGPFWLSQLKQWDEYNYFGPDFKVWKTGQTKEEAILLKDVLCQVYKS